ESEEDEAVRHDCKECTERKDEAGNQVEREVHLGAKRDPVLLQTREPWKEHLLRAAADQIDRQHHQCEHTTVETERYRSEEAADEDVVDVLRHLVDRLND